MSTKDYLEKDYYKVLGVSKTATADEIRSAYRKLARKYHPDANKGDAQAEKKFKEISEAYSVLSDENRRKEYDEARSLFGGAYRPGGGGIGDFNLGDLFGHTTTGGERLTDLFGGLFGGRGRATQSRRGADLETETTLSFTEAVSGTTKSFTLTTTVSCPPAGAAGPSRIDPWSALVGPARDLRFSVRIGCAGRGATWRRPVLTCSNGEWKGIAPQRIPRECPTASGRLRGGRAKNAAFRWRPVAPPGHRTPCWPVRRQPDLTSRFLPRSRVRSGGARAHPERATGHRADSAGHPQRARVPGPRQGGYPAGRHNWRLASDR